MSKRTRLMVDMEPELLDALRATAEAGEISVTELVCEILDSARPSFPDLVKVFNLAKLQKSEALDHLLAMSGKASIAAGQLTLQINDERKARKGRGGKST